MTFRDEDPNSHPIDDSDLFEASVVERYNQSLETIEQFNSSHQDVIQSIIEMVRTPNDTQRQDALGRALDNPTVAFLLRIKDIDATTTDINQRALSVTHLVLSEEAQLKAAFSSAINTCQDHGLRQYDEEAVLVGITSLYKTHEANDTSLHKELIAGFMKGIATEIRHALLEHTPKPMTDNNKTQDAAITYEYSEPAIIDTRPRKLGKSILKVISIGAMIAGGIATVHHLFRQDK